MTNEERHIVKRWNMIHTIVSVLLVVGCFSFMGIQFYERLSGDLITSHGDDIGSIIILFVLTIILFYIEKKVDELEISRHLAEQEKSAQMLVRRDLELTKANEQLSELDQRKSEFLSVVAHQLRTPLSGVKWTLSMLIDGELGKISDDQKVFLKKSYESNERMIQLVDDMLHADRIDAGKYRLELVETSVLDIIDTVLYEMLPMILRKKIKVEFHPETIHISKLFVDPEKIREVFQNLVDNAIKYSPEGGVLTLTATQKDGFVTFAVSDTGMGIPKDQAEQVFSRFFRGRNAMKVETDGTGLGLFIVKGIIDKHRGKIWFESIEDKGSTFFVAIPL